MLFLAVLMKLSWSVTRQMQLGAEVVFQIFAKAGTYPLLFMVGVAMTPWDKLIAALAPANLITIAATGRTIIAGGFFVGRMVNLYPIEAAIVNATHAGQGGTGGVAILTAADRMQLMPFAQIAIRIGGAIVVTLYAVDVRPSALSQFARSGLPLLRKQARWPCQAGAAASPGSEEHSEARRTRNPLPPRCAHGGAR